MPDACRARTLPTRQVQSGSQRAIEPDGDKGAEQCGNAVVDFLDLAVGIEEGNEQKARKTARHGPQHDLDGDICRPPRAPMRVSQMPLAPGTRGHRLIRLQEGEAGVHDTTRVRSVKDLLIPYD